MSTRKNRVDAPRVSPTAIATVQAINEFTNHLTAYGFGFVRREWQELQVSIVSDTYLRPFAKQICKELGYAWVRAHGGYYERYDYKVDAQGRYHSTPMGKYWAGSLTVPKRNYLAPIVAPLLMVATERDGRAPVSSWHANTNWCFRFDGDDGMDIFENQMQFMRTDEAARKALKVLPK